MPRKKKKKVVALVSKHTPKWLIELLSELEQKGSVTVVDVSPVSLSTIVKLLDIEPKIVEISPPKRKCKHRNK